MHPSEPATEKASAGFVTLMALMMSLVALSIDAMLPALSDIGTDLGASHMNDRQQVVTALFLGLATAQMFYGPLSDSIGRRRPIYIGLVVFVIGSLICAFSESMQTMLIGRFIQGFGAASPRVVTSAIIRDRFSGNTMASVMSLMMVIFIIVPALAPAVGQVIVYFFHWRAIFVMFIIIATLSVVWFWARQPETLPVEKRIPFSFASIGRAIKEVVTTPITIGYTVAAGLVFGAFLGFLNSAQQILQEQYDLGVRFPAYFAMLAVAFGVASFVNSKLVMRFGMRSMTLWSIRGLTVISVIFLAWVIINDSDASLTSFMVYLILTGLFIGTTFGNFTALAMEPMGHIAGVASSVIGSLTTLVSLVIGAIIGRGYDGTIVPLIMGYAVMSVLCYGVIVLTERRASSAR